MATGLADARSGHDPRPANIVGLIGSVLMVVTYTCSNFAAELDFRLFNLLNLVGSLMLIGLVRSLRKRSA